MAQSSRQFIAQLKRDKRFMGTCPSCSADFRLSDAILYSVADTPPEEAVAVIQSIREAISERKQELKRARPTPVVNNLMMNMTPIKKCHNDGG